MKETPRRQEETRCNDVDNDATECGFSNTILNGTCIWPLIFRNVYIIRKVTIGSRRPSCRRKRRCEPKAQIRKNRGSTGGGRPISNIPHEVWSDKVRTTAHTKRYVDRLRFQIIINVSFFDCFFPPRRHSGNLTQEVSARRGCNPFL